MKEIVEGLYQWISRLSGSQQPVTSYVWRGTDGAVLVDPAVDLTPDVLHGVRLADVSDIFITHVQDEHIAGCLNFPEARIHAPAGDEYLCQGVEHYLSHIQLWQPPYDWTTRGNFLGHLAGAPNERPAPRALTLHEPLMAGRSIGGFEVIATPGHGKHAVTLLVTINGTRYAFCGDLILGQGQLWNWFDCDWDYGLQSGQRQLLTSLGTLDAQRPDVVCPAHGDPIAPARPALRLLAERLGRVLGDSDRPPGPAAPPVNFPDSDSPALGWREILPSLHQWRTGNCAVLISETGNALMVDDGLCYWEPLPDRREHHKTVLQGLKKSLGIARIEIVIPTHYHGDHTENIPEVVEWEGSRVICLDSVCEPMEHPERFRLAATLPWYATSYDRITIDEKVTEGARLRWHEYELEFFHLGGQTWYHLGLAVMVAGKKVIFVGDAMFNWDAACEPVLTYNDAEPSTRGWAHAIDRILEHEPDLLVCGHGGAIVNPMALLKLKQEAWRKQIADFQTLTDRDLRQFFDPFI